jgi:hypothetical protein
VAESGVNDDWSYTKTALDLAETGHLKYNGWAAAMVGAQAYWGALFIKLFGFSFLVVRLSTAPLAAGCAALLYLLHRRANLPRNFALFGTLVIALSAVFIPNAASFMTDIPGYFFFLASVYAYVRAAVILNEPAAGKTSISFRLPAWIVAGLVMGLLGGTIRQVNWFVPILVPGFLMMRQYSLRRTTNVRLLAANIFIAFAGAFAFSRWFGEQPYAIHEKVSDGVLLLFTRYALDYLSSLSAQIIQTLGIILFPMLVMLPWLYRRWLMTQSRRNIRVLETLCLAVSLWFLAWLLFQRKVFFPWLGNLLTPEPYLLGSAPAPNDSIPPTLPLWFWKMFGFAVSVLICWGLAWGIAVFFLHRRIPIRDIARNASGVFVVLGIFCAGYIPLLLLKGLVPESFGIWDRYLLPVLPLVTVAFLGLLHRLTSWKKVPLPAWIIVVMVAIYVVAQTHDYFAQLRARVVLTKYLEQRQIPRTRILGGFEYDSWTQITVAGHYNDPRIKKPSGTFVLPPKSLGFGTMYEMWHYTPIVRPDYVVAIVPHPALFATDVPPEKFHCWLPPFERQLEVQVRDPSQKNVSSRSGETAQ